MRSVCGEFIVFPYIFYMFLYIHILDILQNVSNSLGARQLLNFACNDSKVAFQEAWEDQWEQVLSKFADNFQHGL